MASIHLPGAQITDFEVFHLLCKEQMGLFEGYGMNWNAWIDCLTYLDDSGGGLSTFHLAPGEQLTIEVSGIDELQARLPDLVSLLVQCSGFVNARHLAAQKSNRIALVFIGYPHPSRTPNQPPAV